MSRGIYDYDSNGLARMYNDTKWCLVDKNERQVSDWYSYIEEWGEGYYKAEMGIKKNILRPDGTLVLKEWHNDVYKVRKGLFLFSNTIRKSKTNPKTRYTYGVAHVNGDVIFPMIFDRAHWFDDKDLIYVEIGTTPYVVSPDGSIYDPARSHLPKKGKIDEKDFIEKFVNWTLPGLQFFYRDTDAPVIVDTTYHVGDVLRAGIFVDVTTKLLKPVHKTRFLIASAHAAMLCEIDELCEQNPNVKKWNLCTMHFNSHFKVMDVYEKEGVTQVFLLHIPAAAAFFLGHSTLDFLDQATGREASLVEMARNSLDEKLQMEVHPRSLDKEFVERMYHPIGLDDEFYPISPAPVDEPEEGEIAHISKMVHKMAQDDDIENFISFEDNFPYDGVAGSVCEGCIYAKGIQGHGEGCGRLFIKSFRERYLKGRCEYRKTDLFKQSHFEEMERYRKEKEKDTAEKQSDVFALRLVREFIDEELGGDIHKLRDFDFYAIKDNAKYGDNNLQRANIIRSIMALVFADAWPALTVDAIEHYQYWCGQINDYGRLLGANIMDEYFKGLQEFCPTPEQHQRALRVAHLTYSIGNFWVVPNKAPGTDTLGSYKDGSKYKGYMDKYLQALYEVFAEAKKPDMNLKGILYKNRKVMADYQGEEGFKRFVANMMLDDYVDQECKPKEIFMFVWCFMKDLDKETYMKAVDQYCSFLEVAIPKRADMIIERLEKILNKK